ncbi:GTP-binding protein [Bacillaceae bacterium Marseille-Q3522]|nr:GTP-binding protein [Bacillaceae bacterium Marseille-Q3522]
MTTEKQFIEKLYYKKFMDDNKLQHPIETLGDLYFAEQEKEVSDLSYIRFAQGEVYFHYKDYESAIFKWENITNELEPWAKKNTADAYMELGIYPTAESIYKEIETGDLVLNTEITLQLFTLYIEQDKLDLATDMIKYAVSVNPDYPNVTKLARAFFEGQLDWGNAIKLALDEGIRTTSLHWFDILQRYVEKGVTKSIEPAYFHEGLQVLAKTDKAQFEELVVSFWESYKDEPLFIDWLTEVNRLFSDLEKSETTSWEKASSLYNETYFYLIGGDFLIKQLSSIMPALLKNWLTISESGLSAAAVLAWNELFPAVLSEELCLKAKEVIKIAKKDTNGFSYYMTLFASIIEWAKGRGLEIGENIKMIMNELVDVHNQYIFVSGGLHSGKAAFINSLAEEEIAGEENTIATIIRYDDKKQVLEITKNQDETLSENEVPSANGKITDADERLRYITLPSRFLLESDVAIVDGPFYQRKNNVAALTHIQFSDSLLYLLNGNEPFTDNERDLLLQLKDTVPDLPIHFILNQTGNIFEESDTIRLLARINIYFPESTMFVYDPENNSDEQKQQLAAYLKSNVFINDLTANRTAKLLFFIRKLISGLLDKRVEMENKLLETIEWNEQLHAKLTGAIHQLGDIEKEKIAAIKEAYQSKKEKWQQEIKLALPKVLRGSADFIKEDSDFSRIHEELNKEMNRRVEEFLQENIFPIIYRDMKKWIEFAEDQFTQGKAFLEEISDGFNKIYQQDRLSFSCDFKVLDDWRRDTDRLTSGIKLENVNIILRFSPGQFLLKSAGKLFSVLPQNHPLLYNKYKQYVENESYDTAIEKIIRKIFVQFELFENSIERDVSFFFKDSFTLLHDAVDEAEKQQTSSKDGLEELKEKPEMYNDPFTLFDLRLRQYEWLMKAQRETHSVM